MILKVVFGKQNSFPDNLADTGKAFLLAYIFEKIGQWMKQKWLKIMILPILCKQGISFVNTPC